VARDMDLLRQAVGDQKLNYVGYSYGTFLGATYGKLFPDRIRTMVLDGTVDPKTYVGKGDDRSLGRRLEQHVAAAQTYQQFLQLCQEAGPKQCALAGLGDPEEVVENLFDQLSENPIEVPGPDGSTTEFGYDDAVLMIFQAMYSPTQWQDLATALAQMVQHEQSDPSEQSDQSDQSEQSKKSNRYLARPSEQDSIRDLLRKSGFFPAYNSAGVALAIMCTDTQSPGILADFPAQADAAAEEA